MSQKNNKYNKRRKHPNRSMMPILLAVGGMILIFTAFLAVKGGSGGTKVPVDVKGTPSLKVDKDKVDLGDVKLGRTVEVSFQVSNTGDQPLRLSETPYVVVVEGC